MSAAVVDSTNILLTPQISWTLGGSGADRTITVTHSGNRTGTVTIRLTVEDWQCSSRDDPSTSRRPQHVPAGGLHDRDRDIHVHRDNHKLA